MEGIDFVYSVSTPFFLGDMLKALEETEKVELPESDLEQFRMNWCLDLRFVNYITIHSQLASMGQFSSKSAISRSTLAGREG